MTFVFRSSTFFIVFVISFKMTTFVIHDTSVSVIDERISATLEHLIDESVRFRQELEDAADTVAQMADAMYTMDNRAICWMRDIINRGRNGTRSITSYVGATVSAISSLYTGFMWTGVASRKDGELCTPSKLKPTNGLRKVAHWVTSVHVYNGYLHTC